MALSDADVQKQVNGSLLGGHKCNEFKEKLERLGLQFVSTKDGAVMGSNPRNAL